MAMDHDVHTKVHGRLVSLLVLLLFAIQRLICCRPTSSRLTSHTQVNCIPAEEACVIELQSDNDLLASMNEQTLEGLTSPLHLHREP